MKAARLACSTMMLTLTLSACADMSVKRSESVAQRREEKTIVLNSFLFGIVPAPRLYQDGICANSRIETMHLTMSGSDVGLAIVTLGVYVRQHAVIECATQ